MTAIRSPIDYYADLSGRPLESGSVYFGVSGQDPETNPIVVYWDAALTQVATQPLTLTAGYIVHSGARAQVFTSGTAWSVRTRDRTGAQVDYFPTVSAVMTAADLSRRLVYITDAPYNADPTGVADCAAAFTAAFAAESYIYIPPGTYTLSSMPTAPTGSIVIEGAGSGATLLLIAHTGTGLRAAPASTNDRVSFTGLTMRASSLTGPTALGLDVEFPSAASYPYTQLIIDDVIFESNLATSTAPWASTWSRGIRLKNVWCPVINNIAGSSYPDVGNTGATGFLEIIGGSYGCIAGIISNISWYNGAVGILGTAYMEGIDLSHFAFVGVTRGIYVPSSTPIGGAAATYRAQAIWLRDGHIAAHTACVDMDLTKDITSTQCNMVRLIAASATDWKCYNYNNVTYATIEGGAIDGNEASGGVTTCGIFATGAGSSHGIVTGVQFGNCDTQFNLGNLVQYWTINDNRSVGTTPDAFTIDGGSTHNNIVWLKTDGTIYRVSDNLTGYFANGSYTPTLTGVANVAATTAYLCYYSRFGNTVMVRGKLDIDPTASTTLTKVGISLPVASNFSADTQCGGAAGSADQGTGGAVYADATNDRAELSFKCDTLANGMWTFAFSYEAI